MRGGRVRAISSTSLRAITPPLGGKLGQASGGILVRLPPSDGAIGLRELAHELDFGG